MENNPYRLKLRFIVDNLKRKNFYQFVDMESFGEKDMQMLVYVETRFVVFYFNFNLKLRSSCWFCDQSMSSIIRNLKCVKCMTLSAGKVTRKCVSNIATSNLKLSLSQLTGHLPQ